MKRRTASDADPAVPRDGAAGSDGLRHLPQRAGVDRWVAGSRQTIDGPLPGRPVVVALLPAHSGPDLTEALHDSGFAVAPIVEFVTVLDSPGIELPDLAVIDDDELDDDDTLRVLEALAGAYVPSVVVGRRAQRRIVALRRGADDFVARPLDGDDLVQRLRGIVRRCRALRSMSPLTGLPGNAEIDEVLTALVARSTPDYAVLYADLDNFKAYNDTHGFAFGDTVLRTTAQVLRRALGQLPGPLNFLGHLGGDDFVLVTDVDNAGPLCGAILERFDAYAASLPRAPAPGRVRRLLRRRVALSISIGVATTEHRPLASAWEVSAVATEMKHLAKTAPGSCYAFDRRSGWARMPPRAGGIEVAGKQAEVSAVRDEPA